VYNIHLTNRGFLIWKTKPQLKRPSRFIGNPSSVFGLLFSVSCLRSSVFCPIRPFCPACHEFISQFCKTNPILQTTKLPQHLMPHRFTAIFRSAPPPKTNPIKANPPTRYATRNTQYEKQTQSNPIPRRKNLAFRRLWFSFLYKSKTLEFFGHLTRKSLCTA